MAKKKKAQRKVTTKTKKRVFRALPKRKTKTQKLKTRPRTKPKPPKRKPRFTEYKNRLPGVKHPEQVKRFVGSFKPIWLDRDDAAEKMEKGSIRLKKLIGEHRPTVWRIQWLYMARTLDDDGLTQDEKGAKAVQFRKFEDSLRNVKKMFLDQAIRTGTKSAFWIAPLSVSFYAVYIHRSKTSKNR